MIFLALTLKTTRECVSRPLALRIILVGGPEKRGLMCAANESGEHRDRMSLCDAPTPWPGQDLSPAGPRGRAQSAGAQFQAFLDAIPDALLLIDRHFAIRAVNHEAQRLFGYAAADMVGMQIDRLIPDRFREQHREYQDGYFTDPRPRRMGSGIEIVGLTKNGKEIPIDISIRPLQTDEGVFVCAAIRDMTAQKMAVAALLEAKVKAEQANLAKSRFLAAASRDLRQPLQAIALLKDILEKSILDPSAQSALAKIDRNLDAMSDILNTLLDVDPGAIKPPVAAFGSDDREAHPDDDRLADIMERRPRLADAPPGAQPTERVRASSRIATLTERERDVMDQVIKGHPNKMIAFMHGVSQRTIEFQRRSMMTKLGVKTVPDLVRLVIAAGTATHH